MGAKLVEAITFCQVVTIASKMSWPTFSANSLIALPTQTALSNIVVLVAHAPQALPLYNGEWCMLLAPVQGLPGPGGSLVCLKGTSIQENSCTP